jgi:hypothetical protein
MLLIDPLRRINILQTWIAFCLQEAQTLRLRTVLWSAMRFKSIRVYRLNSALFNSFDSARVPLYNFFHAWALERGIGSQLSSALAIPRLQRRADSTLDQRETEGGSNPEQRETALTAHRLFVQAGRASALHPFSLQT